MFTFDYGSNKSLSTHRTESTLRLFVSSSDAVVNGLDHNSSLGSPLTVQWPQVSCPHAHSMTDVTRSSAENVLATGSGNGEITLWVRLSHNASRFLDTSVPSIVSCSVPWELLTISQDWKLNLFDTVERKPVISTLTFIQRVAVPNPVRDVTYCPRNSYLFAAAQENGTLSIWDTRQSGRPYLAFQGHSCSIA
ncbi:WD repeat-containing protein 24 [Clonorchis sinensis]|uniref:GATOR2 complex protein WDR24 n=1 Tax=Clonorchis sinensis TaxID=79923 RepID=A0A8T1LZ77_CLOSI|nr:WD repeat-containing protein 24 [Clonorchis sinensis]